MLDHKIDIWDQIAGNWRQFKGAVTQQWAKLTDDDMAYIGGGREKLIGKLQERYGYSKEEATHEVNRWSNALDQA